MSELTQFPLVSIIIVNTNELHHLVTCLPAVAAQTYPNYEVLIVDNGSSDGSLDYVEQSFPAFRIIRNNANLGYAKANNIGFASAQGAYLAVLNPDTGVEPEWLAELIAALENDPAAGLATSKILFWSDPVHINTCGNAISVSGLTFCRGFGRPANDPVFAAPEAIAAVSGAAFVIRRSTLAEIGPFDEDFFIYLEDTDLSLRAMLAGYTCLYVPTSVVRHKYIFKFGERKCFDMEKNRYFMLAKTFHVRTLLMASPILFFTEALVWGYMLLKGPRYMRQKFRSYIWLWQNRAKIRQAHRVTQRYRRISDRAIFQKLEPQFQFDLMVKSKTATLLDSVTAPVLAGCAKVALTFIQ